jgi:hypothetical protein
MHALTASWTLLLATIVLLHGMLVGVDEKSVYAVWESIYSVCTDRFQVPLWQMLAVGALLSLTFTYRNRYFEDQEE